MSDEQSEQEPTREELVEMLNNQALLDEHGYRLTPKGYMGLVLMERGIPTDLAAEIAQDMENRIFLGGFTYLHTDQLGGFSFEDADGNL